MKLLCLVENLKNSVAQAERITTKNQNLPLLQTVKISIQENRVKLVTTNLELGLEIFTTCKIIKEGECLLPAKLLQNYLNSVSDKQIALEVKDFNTYITTDINKSTVKGFDPKEFPIIPKVQEKYSFKTSLQNLQDAFVQTLPAVSLSDTKPEISSVAIKFFNSTAKIAATDSFRLAEKTIVVRPNGELPKSSVLIPSKTIQEFTRLRSESQEVSVVFNNNHILFSTTDFRLTSRLTEGVFPEYTTIIPKNFSTKVQIQKDAFVTGIKSASIFSGRLSDVTISVSENAVNISARNTDLGEHAVSLDTKIEGDPVVSSFNFKYILDGLSQLQGKKLFIGFNGEQKPLFIRDDEDESYFYLVMPMRGT